MAKLNWRVRSLAWILAHAPGGTVASMTPEQMVKAQQRLAGHGKLAVGVTGSLAKGVVTENRLIEQDGERVPVRIYRSERQSAGGPVIINFHGGGFTLGALDQSDWLCSQVCIGVGAVVVSVDYRLAPTYRFPLAVVDSLAAVKLGRRARRRTGGGRRPDRRDGRQRGWQPGHRRLPVAAGQRRTEDHPPGLDVPGDRSAHPGGIRPRQPGGGRLARSCPRPAWSASGTTTSGPTATRTTRWPRRSWRDDLSGLPPALIQVAEYDPLRDDGIRYARAMQAAGDQVRLTEYVGMPHGYFSFPKVIRGSIKQALAELCAEQRYALHADPVPTAFPRVPAGLPTTTAETDAGRTGRSRRPHRVPPGRGPPGRAVSRCRSTARTSPRWCGRRADHRR